MAEEERKKEPAKDILIRRIKVCFNEKEESTIVSLAELCLVVGGMVLSDDERSDVLKGLKNALVDSDQVNPAKLVMLRGLIKTLKSECAVRTTK